MVPEALPFVSAGDGLRTEDPTDYVPALHRGEVSLFLKRERAGEPKFCGLVVYTRDAYLKDPDMDDKETARILAAPCTHVLVAVIVSSGLYVVFRARKKQVETPATLPGSATDVGG